MLSWSSTEAGADVDLTAVAADHPAAAHPAGEPLPLDHGAALLSFATACAQRDDAALDRAGTALVDETDLGFMVDAAAVAANFEMMTRLADSTGARMPAATLENRAAVIGAMGVAELTSRR